MGQILEYICKEAVNSRRHFYQQPLLSSHTATNEQVTHQTDPNLRHEADKTTSASGRIASNAATGIDLSTTSILDDPVAMESNTSASTTPTSDTTASDTDPGDSQNHYQKPSPMENGD